MLFHTTDSEDSVLSTTYRLRGGNAGGHSGVASKVGTGAIDGSSAGAGTVQAHAAAERATATPIHAILTPMPGTLLDSYFVAPCGAGPTDVPNDPAGREGLR